jgi:hypothetical protein
MLAGIFVWIRQGLFVLAISDACFHGSKAFQFLCCGDGEQDENVSFERMMGIKFFLTLWHCRMISRD